MFEPGMGPYPPLVRRNPHAPLDPKSSEFHFCFGIINNSLIPKPLVLLVLRVALPDLLKNHSLRARYTVNYQAYKPAGRKKKVHVYRVARVTGN